MKKLVVAAAVLATALSACGGGGGGGGGSTGGPPPTQPSISGDMLALQANRGWNYQGTNSGTSLTVSTYVDPTRLSSGDQLLVGTAATGLLTTVLTDHNSAEAASFGGLSFSQSAGGYNVTAEATVSGAALVPGSPLFVSSTLTQGATSTPYPGVTDTVLAVGTVPGASACPAPGTGATVQFAFQGNTYKLSFVPGCGITQFVGPTGASLTLTSVGSYNIGNLAAARKVQSVTPLDTARTLLGLNRNNDFPAAKLIGGFLK